MLDLTERDRERFEKFVYADPMSGCWLWGGSLDESGYGKFTFYRKGHQSWVGAHRVSWLLRGGDDPGKLMVLHRCDNPACVNPDHLWLGTHRDNQVDKLKKGRGRGRPRTLPRDVSRGRGGKFRARLRVDGRAINFGTYPTVGEAASAAKHGREEYLERL